MSDASPRRFADCLPTHWRTDFLVNEPFASLDRLFGLGRLAEWPDCRWLTTMGMPVAFVPQEGLDFQGLSYEAFIAKYAQVPTRERNWHDLFNALVWRQFPRTKAALNQLHMADIEKHGAKHRTPRRHRITHFDECGVILAYADPRIPCALREHRWHDAMVECREAWGQQIQAFVFGHANYEMLLRPYIGLTGKWLGVEVAPGFFALDEGQQRRELDQALFHQLVAEDCLAGRGALHPLPLLGVPLWWAGNADPAFYDNQAYFQPKPRR